MELDAEIREQLKAAADSSDLEKIHDILDALESADHPEIVKVEFTRTQMKDLEYVRQKIGQPNIPTVLRLMVDGFVPGFKKAQKAAHRAQAPG